jgi:hypothetical protein
VAKSSLETKITGNADKLVSELARSEKQVAKLEDRLARTGKKGQKAGKEMEGGFRGAAQSIASTLTRVVSMSAAIGMISKGLADINARSERAAGIVKGTGLVMGSLSELAGGDPAKFRQLTRYSRQLFAAGGAESLPAAVQTIYQLGSAEQLEYRGLFGKLYGTLKDPASMAKYGTAFMTTFGEKRLGGLRPVISMAEAANVYAPASGPEILEAATRAASGGEVLGWSAAELISAAAVLAKAKGDAPRAGTMLRSLASAMRENPKGRFMGMGLMEGVGEIEAMGLSEPELKKLLGRKEAVEAYGLLANLRPLMEKATTDISAAASSDRLGRMVKARKADPVVITQQEHRIAKAARILAELPEGVARTITDTIMDSGAAAMEKTGASAWAITARDWAIKTGRFFAGNEWVIRNAGLSRVQQELHLGKIQAEKLGEMVQPVQSRRLRAAADEIRDYLDDQAGITPGGRVGELGRLQGVVEALERAAEKLDSAADKLGANTPVLVSPGGE